MEMEMDIKMDLGLELFLLNPESLKLWRIS